MRDIRFRAWNKNKKEIFYPGMISENSQIEHKMGFWWFELMQFTWLKDKNWKDIYEWDVLQYINNEWDSTDIYFVEWNKRWFVWRWSKRKEWEFNECDGLDCPERDMEIIWNLYENPELLKS